MARKKKNNNQSRLGLILVIALLVMTKYVACGCQTEGDPTSPYNLHLSTIVTSDQKNTIPVQHTGFALSYSTRYNTPVWVAWELTRAEKLGTEADRGDYKFIPDPLLPEANQVVTSDYTGSGYDRGHMCPAADMKWSADAMNDCHYMSNICPQAPKLNQEYWERLESACRRWAERDGAIYIVCGPHYKKGVKRTTIGSKHEVTVPDGFFKVVICVMPGLEKGIGFYYDNSEEKQTMESQCMTIDAVEKKLGMDFFAELPDDIENKIESQNNLREWN